VQPFVGLAVAEISTAIEEILVAMLDVVMLDESAARSV